MNYQQEAEKGLEQKGYSKEVIQELAAQLASLVEIEYQYSKYLNNESHGSNLHKGLNG